MVYECKLSYPADLQVISEDIDIYVVLEGMTTTY